MVAWSREHGRKGPFQLRAWKRAFFLLLIFPRLKLKRALSKVKKLIKQRIIFSTLVVETGLNDDAHASDVKFYVVSLGISLIGYRPLKFCSFHHAK